MEQVTKTKFVRLRALHTSVLSWRRTPANDFLLSDVDFRFAADCERMRVDRNGSALSLLLVRLHQQQSADEDIAFFARVLEGRLRVTDTPGQLKDGRVAILLPDTSAAGAWKVAADISEVYPPGPARPECEVLVYHGSGAVRDKNPAAYENSVSNNDDSNDADSSDQDAEESENEVAASPVDDRSTGGPTGNEEFFFAKSLPLWKRSLDVFGGTIGLVASLPILIVAAA